MKEFIINLFFGILCGVGITVGITVVMEMVITASLAFIDLIKEFKERRKKDD